MRSFDRRNGVGRTRRQKRRLLMKCGNRSRRFHRIVQVVGESCTHFPFRMRRISSQRIEIASNAGILSRSPPGNQTRCCPESIRAPKMKNNSPLCESCRFPKTCRPAYPCRQSPHNRAKGSRLPATVIVRIRKSRHVTTSRLDRRDVAFVSGMGALAFVKTAFSLSCDPTKKPLDANFPF